MVNFKDNLPSSFLAATFGHCLFLFRLRSMAVLSGALLSGEAARKIKTRGLFNCHPLELILRSC